MMIERHWHGEKRAIATLFTALGVGLIAFFLHAVQVWLAWYLLAAGEIVSGGPTPYGVMGITYALSVVAGFWPNPPKKD